MLPFLEDRGADAVTLQPIAWLISAMSAVGGSLVTLVVFRTKIALMDRENESREKEIETITELHKKDIEEVKELNRSLVTALETQLDRRLDMMTRVQRVMLKLLADIAGKVGVERRFQDAVIELLSSEEGAT